MASDYYEVFGVAPDADIETIKQRYRVLVRENHPDVSSSEDAHARMQLILEAWSVLSQPAERKRYDLVRQADTKRAGAPAPDGSARATTAHSGTARPGNTPRSRSGSPRPKVDVNPRANNPRTRLLTMVFEAAQLYKKEGRAEEAISLCNRVLKSDPKNSEAADLLGDIYAGQGRDDLALLMYKRAMQNQPNMLLYRQKWEALQHRVAPEAAPAAATPASPSAGTSVARGSRQASTSSSHTPPPAPAPTSSPAASRSAGCGAIMAILMASILTGFALLLTAL